jgi:poly(A) polymerase
MRLLVAARGPQLVSAMLDYGLLPLVLGLAPRPSLLSRLAALEAHLAREPDAILRLAALAVEVPEDAEHLQGRLRLSNEATARVVQLAVYARAFGAHPSARGDRALLYAHGAAAYRDAVMLAWTRSGSAAADDAWRRRLALPDHWQAPRFPVGGGDVMALGVPAGPRVGELLRMLEDWWIGGDFAADEAALRTKLAELART